MVWMKYSSDIGISVLHVLFILFGKLIKTKKDFKDIQDAAREAQMNL